MVVTNSGPLMALGKLNCLNQLGQLYEKVFMPNAVYSEVVERGFAQGCLDSLQVKMALKRNYLEVMSVKTPNPWVENLPLHIGEKEALNLALENKASLILMDDLLAREQAQKLGLKVKGTLGIIVSSYRNRFLSLLEEVRITFETIIKRNDIWIAEGLCRSILNRLDKE